MINLEENQTNEINFLIEEQLKGINLLFTPAEVKKYINKDYQINDMDFAVFRIEEVLTSFLEIDGIENKRQYFLRSSDKNKEIILRAFYIIVDNTTKKYKKIVLH